MTWHVCAPEHHRSLADRCVFTPHAHAPAPLAAVQAFSQNIACTANARGTSTFISACALSIRVTYVEIHSAGGGASRIHNAIGGGGLQQQGSQRAATVATTACWNRRVSAYMYVFFDTARACAAKYTLHFLACARPQ